MKEKVKFSASEKSLFFSVLKKRVDQYFVDNNISRHANQRMVIKTIVLLSLYIVPFLIFLTVQPRFSISLFLWFLMGLGISGIGMSIMHDANHGAYSQNPQVNKWLGYTIYFAGGGVANWKWQHNLLHHTYTNVVPMDEDIRDRGVVKLSPHAVAQSVHQFQWIYAFFFYSLMTLYWVILKDFNQYVSFIRSGVNSHSAADNRKMLIDLILLKVLYFGILLGLPIWAFHLPWQEVLLGFLLMHFTSGLLLTVIFQLAHTVEGTQHPLVEENNTIAKDWAVHQLETTVNFSPDNAWLSWYIGGLNYQIEHHLFPKICHVHYPKIAPIVKQTAAEFGLVYLENPSFGEALKSHVSTLKRFGRLPSPVEAIG